MQYVTVRSHQRKTLGIQVKPDKVIVRAPAYLTDTEVERLVATKYDWIRQKLKQLANVPIKKVRLLCHGCEVLLYGRTLTISLDYQTKSSITVTDDNLHIMLAKAHSWRYQEPQALHQKLSQLLTQFYTEQLSEYLAQTLPILSRSTGFNTKCSQIKKYKARWGSCNSKGQLSFNALLAAIPHHIIDYVIIHELCHLKHLNHSPAFWQLVAKFYPDFKSAEHQLKRYQVELSQYSF